VSGRTNGVVQVRIRRLPGTEDLPLPVRASEQAAGMDLRAAVVEPLVLAPGERNLIPTGIAVALPPDHEGQVRPRSGLAVKHGLALVNSPGTIDADYRGEIRVIMINLGSEPVRLERGDRIAQLVVQRLPRVEWEPVDSLDETERGAGGFGHTGDR